MALPLSLAPLPIASSCSYTHPIMFDTSKPHGITPYGVTTIAGGKGEQSPLPEELEAAANYGKRLVKVAAALKA